MDAETMTSADAARVLDVSLRQVQRLAEVGTIEIVARVGRSVLLDSRSVLTLRQAGIARGRAWNESTVWAAIGLLDGLDDIALADRSRRWHLRERLRQMTADDLVRQGRHRARIVRYRASSSYLEGVAEQITRAGGSAIDADMKLAHLFGLTAVPSATVDGYVTGADADALAERFFLVEDRTGNVTLRLTGTKQISGSVASVPVVALDLADSLDTRQRSAGLRVLTDLMDKV